MSSYTDSTGALVNLDDVYVRQRARAERIASSIAASCVIQFAETGEPVRRGTPGQRFMALGGCDKEGPWSFVVDYASPEDRADVDAFLAVPA